MIVNEWQEQWQTILAEFREQISTNQVVVIGCSTSEVIGKKIGTAGANEVSEMLYEELEKLQQQTNVFFAFQCCEHLNRALVVERELAEKKQWELVTVIPIKSAGGAMATYAFQKMKNPVVVEFIQADAGIDIGDTFIGMHIRHVAVPVRVSLNDVGHAHVTLAISRPKLIGGERAIYQEM